MALTPKQERFVREYLIDLNTKQAAIRAGYSAKTAYSAGPRLMKHAEVRQAVALAQEELAARAGRRAEDVLGDIRDVGREARADGDLKTALKAYELEGKHLGLFKDKVETTLSGKLTIAWQE